jgi:hypothetical protein
MDGTLSARLDRAIAQGDLSGAQAPSLLVRAVGRAPWVEANELPYRASDQPTSRKLLDSLSIGFSHFVQRTRAFRQRGL